MRNSGQIRLLRVLPCGGCGIMHLPSFGAVPKGRSLRPAGLPLAGGGLKARLQSRCGQRPVAGNAHGQDKVAGRAAGIVKGP